MATRDTVTVRRSGARSKTERFAHSRRNCGRRLFILAGIGWKVGYIHGWLAGHSHRRTNLAGGDVYSFIAIEGLFYAALGLWLGAAFLYGKNLLAEATFLLYDYIEFCI